MHTSSPQPPAVLAYVTALLLLSITTALAQPLPDPLPLEAVTQFALQHRTEIVAANARAESLAQRPAIVGALEDPMLAPAIDHYPFRMMEEEDSRGRRFDWNVTIEQRFPMSGVRGHRRAAALADAQRARALAVGVELDVVLDARRSYFMLSERRRMQQILAEQLRLMQQLVSVASNRYASGTGAQADVLRAEVEVARVQAAQQSQMAQVRAAEAMFNASLGRESAEPIPQLLPTASRAAPPSAPAVLAHASQHRPELVAGAAEVDRAGAEVDVMRSMFKPMGMVRLGRASTMADGPGAMVMLGISLPIWRERLHAGVAEARAMQRMANADLVAMRRMVEGEAIVAREAVNAARIQVLMLESEVMPRAQAATEVALASYAAGQGSLISVTESARTLWEVRAEQVMADSVLGEAWARLERSMGSFEEAAP